MKLTKQQIEKINSGLYGQGVCEDTKSDYDLRSCYSSSGIVYNRYETGGTNGGSYDGSEPKEYSVSEKPKFVALARVIKTLYPKLGYLDFMEIEGMIEQTKSSSGTDYYGNSTNYQIDYVPLEKIYNFLEELQNEKQD
jgi:hypothetical protein